MRRTARRSTPCTSLALQLLISDTPVFLWWTSSQPFEDRLLTHLSDSIDRLIVDSAVFKDPVWSLIKMAGMGEVAPPGRSCAGP